MIPQVTGRVLPWILLTALGACAEDPDSICEPGDDPFTISQASIVGNLLTIDVEYTGGCEKHEFEFWWGGSYGTSDPPLVPLEIQHRGNGDGCKALISDRLLIDLTTLSEIGGESLRLQLVTGLGAVVYDELVYDDSQESVGDSTVLPIRTECGRILY
ncbi:MAG: hypothetical protein GY811_10640 [Myxococcales bacterium]|nr:hypothetical protein [Myxococcales bacterium]